MRGGQVIGLWCRDGLTNSRAPDMAKPRIADRAREPDRFLRRCQLQVQVAGQADAGFRGFQRQAAMQIRRQSEGAKYLNGLARLWHPLHRRGKRLHPRVCPIIALVGGTRNRLRRDLKMPRTR